jgi:2-polyprenyl-6-methoxyphenol hydroxylase-like FAD-dependent oxidoreductase
VVAVQHEEVPVVVVGGSLVGLSTAVFLADQGVVPLVVERHDGTAIHPRAGHFHLRTLELLRSVGLEEAVQRLSAERFFPNGGINQVETLAGGEVASYIAELNEGVEAVSPSRRLFVAQDALEPLLRERAEQLGARLSYATEATIVDSDPGGVTLELRGRHDDSQRTVRTPWVVAADGSRSPIRRQLGIELTGFGHLSRSATIYFRADCAELLEGANQGVIYVANEQLRGFFRFERSGTRGFLAVNTLGDPRGDGALDVTAGLDADRAAELVRAAIGVSDIGVTIDDLAPWEATADVAERYRDGRVLLAGDAVHPLPPNGGFGGNTGVQDAHNLAWKLALVVKGVAGDDLLDSYDAERRPVGRLTVEQAYTRYMRRVTPELADGDLPDLVHDLSMEIGYLYGSDELVADPRTSAGRPGSRAPHVPLRHGGATLSSLDLFGGGQFVLLAGPDGAPWAGAAQEAAQALGVPLATHVLGPDIDPSGRFPEAYGVPQDGATLVRPDGFVAWRSSETPELEAALRAAVCAPVNDRRSMSR